MFSRHLFPCQLESVLDCSCAGCQTMDQGHQTLFLTHFSLNLATLSVSQSMFKKTFQSLSFKNPNNSSVVFLRV